MSSRGKRILTYVAGGLVGNSILSNIFSGGTAAPTDSEFDEKALDTHRVDSLNLLLYTLLLILTVVTIWMFKNRRLRFLHETGLAVIYGLVLGAVIRFSGNSQSIRGLVVVPKYIPRQQNSYNLSLPPEVLWLQLARRGKAASSLNKTYSYTFKGEVDDVVSNGIEQKATFDPEIFFNILLPPIIFHAAYSMKRRFFFKNLGAIFTFAFIGTTITAFATGGIMWSLIQIVPSLSRKFSFLDTLYFGAVISATDPVTVLAIFSELHVDVNLYALVFGESVLNDAIAIVMTGAIQSYSEYNTGVVGFEMNAFFRAVGDFVWIFCASFLLGSFVGIGTSLLTKFTRIRDFPLLETCLFVLMSYSAFLIAEASDLTGIVSLLFCGMCQAHYTYNNLSPESRLWTKSLFELLNFLAENFIFSYIGVSMFTFPKHHFDWSFIPIAFIAVALGRAANIYPLSLLLNIGRKPKITFNFQHMLYFSGLRGAMAFALAIRNTLSEARQMFLTATAMIVIVSVIAIGGSVTALLAWFGIPVGVEDENEPIPIQRQVGYEAIGPLEAAKDLSLVPDASTGFLTSRQTPAKVEKAWLARIWGGFDTKYMKPLLTNSHPTLIETLPKFCGAFARLMTTTEQLTEMYYRNRTDSDADLCIAEACDSEGVTVQPIQQRVAFIRTASSEEDLPLQSFRGLLPPRAKEWSP